MFYCCCRYDYILRTETMDNDASFILPLLNRSIDYIQSNSRNVVGSKGKVEKRYEPKMLSIVEELSLEDRMGLWQRYEDELKLFGYEFDAETSTVSCGISSENGSICC